MGGYGSGRRGAKDSTSEYRQFDVRKLQRAGRLTPGQSFNWNWWRGEKLIAFIDIRTEADRLILSYKTRSNGGDWQPMEYAVYLDWTRCTYGGRRAWFRCPATGCGRRVAILYCGGVFACRHCYRLAYESQREADYDRIARRADAIRERLGWEQGILNGKGWTKPKGMHGQTFRRLEAEHDALVAASLAGMMASLQKR